MIIFALAFDLRLTSKKNTDYEIDYSLTKAVCIFINIIIINL